jgi:uncharacterized protein (DUF305 family)
MFQRSPLVVLLLLPGFVSCRSGRLGSPPPLIQPGAPGAPSRVVGAAEATNLSNIGFTDSDVMFMQRMITHHAQAVEMTTLLKTRTINEDLKKLALRIELSQSDEIALMERWLRDRGQPVPDRHAAHQHGATSTSGMPGMLTQEQLDQLAAASGVDFDRLFLEGMIRHHDGALVMVKDLLATPGAAQDSEIFAFISDVDTDQRMEMERMGMLLKELRP